MEDSESLVGFYERAYSHEGPEAAEYARWRALSAVGKADHVTRLCARAGFAPASTLDVGCGDGALLAELSRRSFGGTLAGMEISEPAAEIARRALPGAAIGIFDGTTLPLADGAFELGILSHVLEHVPDPRGAPGRDREGLPDRGARGAARGQRLSAPPGQACAGRGDRPPPAAVAARTPRARSRPRPG